MKNLLKFPSVIMLLYLFSFLSCSSPLDEIVTEETQNVKEEQAIKNNNNSSRVGYSGTTHNINSTMSETTINSILGAANSGDRVIAASGTYHISVKLNMRSGVSLIAHPGTVAIFDARTSSPDQLLNCYYSSNLTDVVFDNIYFYNVRFKIAGQERVTFYNCTFNFGKKLAGSTKSNLNDAYLHFNSNSKSPEVSNCKFYRDAPAYIGRGIYSKTIDAKFHNNVFGTSSHSYFITAINDNGINTEIKSNTIYRAPTSWVDSNQTDHGIYVHSFVNMLIQDNYVKGWPANATGGAVKARNGNILKILNNDFVNSGILLYCYKSALAHPFLKNVTITGNTITGLTSSSNKVYNGIGYWRNSSTFGTEYNIKIASNSLPNGAIKADFSYLNASQFNQVDGGVYNNDTAAGGIYLHSGISQAGNH